MAPLIVHLVAWTGFWLAGRAGLLPAAATPVGALRYALAVMFAFTARTSCRGLARTWCAWSHRRSPRPACWWP
jgi:hypothetical protein